jgi:hypothetical protein
MISFVGGTGEFRYHHGVTENTERETQELDPGLSSVPLRDSVVIPA